LFHPAKTS
jgi:ATP-dependent RNA helicase DDX51/DBP6